MFIARELSACFSALGFCVNHSEGSYSFKVSVAEPSGYSPLRDCEGSENGLSDEQAGCCKDTGT